MATIRIISTKLLSTILNKSTTLHLSRFKNDQNTKWLRYYSSTSSINPKWNYVNLDQAIYEKVCSETLDSLCDYFDELIESQKHLESADVSYSDGVLTVNFGQRYGTYVINRQSPNKQIWLSSPTSGPKRYDFLGIDSAEVGKWIYKHNNESLHTLLQREINQIINNGVDFTKLPYGNS